MSNTISSQTPEPVTKPTLKNNAPDTAFLQDVPSKTNTQFFTVEYSTGIAQNQEDNVKEVLSSVVYFMCRNFKSYSALGFIFDPSSQMFVLNSYHSKSLNIIKEVRIPLGTGVVGKIGTEKRSFMSGDYSFYSPELLYYHEHEEINSILAVPIISESNELLGTLVIDSTDKNTFKEQDKEILKRFSSLAAALITNTRIRIVQERAALTFRIFYEASHRFTTALNLDGVFNVLFEIVPMITTCSRQMAIIYSETEKTGIVYSINGIDNEIPTGLKFGLNNGLYSHVLKNRKLINVPDFIQYINKYYRFSPEEPRNNNIRSLIIFPILDDELRCRGLFSIESNQPNQFHEELEQILSTLIDNASVAFTRALLYKKMEKLATTDGLTELNNHRQFQELLAQELERSRRYNRTVSLLLMDIDHFKSFNDTYGHPVGDLVLKEISSCIRQSIRSNDIPARYGGEEFTVILPETVDKGCITIAERIRESIEKHVIHSLDRQLKVTVSIGCASFNAKKISQKELIDRADKALYYSKEHGRNKVTLYSDGMIKSSK
jgi:diguanylate cyclase (GGDEF)-like protein